MFERAHIVMLECPDVGPAVPHTHTNGRVIQLIRDDKAPFPNQRRDDRRVGREAHGADERIFRADELRDKGLTLYMQIRRAAFESGAPCRDPVPPERFLDNIGTPALGLRKAEVVVGRDIQGAGAFAGELLGDVVIFRGAVEDGDGAACDASDRLGETIVNPSFESAGVE